MVRDISRPIASCFGTAAWVSRWNRRQGFQPQKLFSVTSQRDAAGHSVAVPAVMPTTPLSGTLGQRTKDAVGCQTDRRALSPGALTSPAGPLLTVKEIGFKGPIKYSVVPEKQSIFTSLLLLRCQIDSFKKFPGAGSPRVVLLGRCRSSKEGVGSVLGTGQLCSQRPQPRSQCRQTGPSAGRGGNRTDCPQLASPYTSGDGEMGKQNRTQATTVPQSSPL